MKSHLKSFNYNFTRSLIRQKSRLYAEFLFNFRNFLATLQHFFAFLGKYYERNLGNVMMPPRAFIYDHQHQKYFQHKHITPRKIIILRQQFPYTYIHTILIFMYHKKVIFTGKLNTQIQSNLVIRNFLVTLKLFLNVKCSLSL